MMTLDEAIQHCLEKSKECTNEKCALDHLQLHKWLCELKEYKTKNTMNKKIHILLYTYYEVDDPGGCETTIPYYISEDYNKVKDIFDAVYKEEVLNYDKEKTLRHDDIEVDEYTDTKLSFYIGNWSYTYEIKTYEMDKVNLPCYMQ